MNKIYTRINAAVMAAVVLLSTIAGCSKDEADAQNSVNSSAINAPHTTADPVEINEKTVLTLATFGYSGYLALLIEEFNLTSPDCFVEVIDYADIFTYDHVAGSYEQALMKFNTEVISGNYPDILDITNLPYSEYASAGLLADLYPFIDTDPELSRSSLVESVMRAAEVDGHLYAAFDQFWIQTLVGNPAIVGENTGWNFREFKAVLENHPEADAPLGYGMTGINYLYNHYIATGLDDFINYETGTTSFDTPEFIELLEITAMLPNEFDGVHSWSDTEFIVAGRQIISTPQKRIGSFANYQMYKTAFGGEVVFKGFPNDSRNGNSICVEWACAIVDASPNKDAAWKFVRTLFSEDWQLSYFDIHGEHWSAFSTNQAVFDKLVRNSLAEDFGTNIDYGFEVKPLTQTDIDKILDVINSASSCKIDPFSNDKAMWGIIGEGASDYLSGRHSAEDAAKNIQSRMSILISERS